MLRLCLSRFAKPPLPTHAALLADLQAKSEFLLATQRHGYGAGLVADMGFAPQRDIAVWSPGSNSTSTCSTSSASPPLQHTGQVYAAFAGTVAPTACDAAGAVHSGVVATLADVMTSILVWGFAGAKTVHVSTSIEVQDVRPELRPKVGERLICVCVVPKLGKQLAFTQFEFFRLPPSAAEGQQPSSLCELAAEVVAAGSPFAVGFHDKAFVHATAKPKS